MPREFIGLSVIAVLAALFYVVLRSPPTLPARAEDPIVVVTPTPRPPPPAPPVFPSPPVEPAPPLEPPAQIPPPVVEDASNLPSPAGFSAGGRGRSSRGGYETQEEEGFLASPPQEVAAFYEREMSARGLSLRRWEQPGLVVIEGEGPMRSEIAELRLRRGGGTELVTRSTRWRVTPARAPSPSSASASKELVGDLPLPPTATCSGGGHGSSNDRFHRDASCVVECTADAASFYETVWRQAGFDVRRTLLRQDTTTREVVVGWLGGRRNGAVVISVPGSAYASLHIGSVEKPFRASDDRMSAPLRAAPLEAARD